jgi:hypothetical protein
MHKEDRLAQREGLRVVQPDVFKGHAASRHDSIPKLPGGAIGGLRGKEKTSGLLDVFVWRLPRQKSGRPELHVTA